MRKKIINKKINISISLSSELLDIINFTFTNRSKFITNCIIEELCKNENYKEELIKMKKII